MTSTLELLLGRWKRDEMLIMEVKRKGTGRQPFEYPILPSYSFDTDLGWLRESDSFLEYVTIHTSQYGGWKVENFIRKWIKSFHLGQKT